jgi:hypothetical protein
VIITLTVKALFQSAILVCQTHRDLIVYLVTNKRGSKKWERKKELWKLINLRRLISLTNLLDIQHFIFNLDHLIKRLTRDRDTTSFQFLIRQGSFDASCLSDERSLSNRFHVSKVLTDAKDRKFDGWYHLFFHFI